MKTKTFYNILIWITTISFITMLIITASFYEFLLQDTLLLLLFISSFALGCASLCTLPGIITDEMFEKSETVHELAKVYREAIDICKRDFDDTVFEEALARVRSEPVSSLKYDEMRFYDSDGYLAMEFYRHGAVIMRQRSEIPFSQSYDGIVHIVGISGDIIGLDLNLFQTPLNRIS